MVLIRVAGFFFFFLNFSPFFHPPKYMVEIRITSLTYNTIEKKKIAHMLGECLEAVENVCVAICSRSNNKMIGLFRPILGEL